MTDALHFMFVEPGRLEVARNMLTFNIPIDLTIRSAGLTEEQIARLGA